MSDSHNQLIKDVISDSFGYDIKNIDYFVSALTHKSKSSKNNYERMEILGDSVLQLVITDMLFKKYKDSNEGSSPNCLHIHSSAFGQHHIR